MGRLEMLHRTSPVFVTLQYFVNTYRRSVEHKSKAAPTTNPFYYKGAKKKDFTIYCEMLGKLVGE